MLKSVYLDVHLLAHILSVSVDSQPLRMHHPDPMTGDRKKNRRLPLIICEFRRSPGVRPTGTTQAGSVMCRYFS